MRGPINRLFAAALSLAVLSLASFYFGAQRAAGVVTVTDPNDLSKLAAAQPGDGLMLFGGFLLVVALALASAGLMLWRRERG